MAEHRQDQLLGLCPQIAGSPVCIQEQTRGVWSSADSMAQMFPSPHVGPLLYFCSSFPYAQHTTVWGEGSRPPFAEETLNDFIQAMQRAVQSAPGSAALSLPTHAY